MTLKHKPILSNVGIYRSIADAAYWKMSKDMNEKTQPKPDGSLGVIKTFDPEQMSFKQSMISVVFTCIWLEATLHLLINQKNGSKGYKNQVDRWTYERKLKLLDCRDEKLLTMVGQLRRVRTELVHEKAHLEFNDTGEFTGELMMGQEEAENARAVMLGIEKWFDLSG